MPSKEQDRLQDLQSLQGDGLRGVERPLDGDLRIPAKSTIHAVLHRNGHRPCVALPAHVRSARVWTWSRRPCNLWTTRSARGCHLCL